MSSRPSRQEPTRVGVIGAGQLARMMGDVAASVGVHLTVLATSDDDAAVDTCDDVVIGAPDDLAALYALAERVDVVTFDHELVDLDQITALANAGALVRPGPAALRFAVDKSYQRRRLQRAGLPVPDFVTVHPGSPAVLDRFLAELGGDVVVKAARGGYDGRGVWFPDSHDEARRLVEALGADAVVERRLDLEGEAAQLVVRGVDGAIVHYPLVATVQLDGMCAEVRYPAEVDDDAGASAAQLATRLAELAGAVGVVAVELFATGGGWVVNEVALRPHNTGHWTIEGCATSQFANHLLAVSGRGLGDPRPVTPAAAMVNVVGGDAPATPEDARLIEGVAVHDYGKAWRPGRKLGHVTAVADDARRAHVRAWEGAVAYGTRTREA
ncbi:MAG: 5-(carboxyamino)imidazole ribonucleotide synthase [Acidobacteriota bacterium]|nr:5-(carboxyamino)imidazole ribonucleotide synthase [Acidobacteriota bacterium]